MIRLGFFLLLPILLAYNNCSPATDFGSVQPIESLVDGETIEIITDGDFEVVQPETIEDRYSEEPSEDPSTPDENKDRAIAINDDSHHDDDSDNDGGEEHQEVAKEENHAEDSLSKEPKPERYQRHHHESCRQRLNRQKREERYQDMAISVEEMIDDTDIGDLAHCGHKRGVKKVWVCHIPSGDYWKARSKCLPLPALKHLLEESQARPHDLNYLGRCKKDRDS